MKKSQSTSSFTRKPSPPPSLKRTNSSPSAETTNPRRVMDKNPPQTLSSGAAYRVPRRKAADMLSLQPPPQYRSRRQSRNTSSSKRSLHPGYRNPKLHLDTVSDAGSTSSSPSAGTKTIRSDSAVQSSYYRTGAGSPGPKSVRSDSSKSDTAAAVKKTIEVLNKSIADDNRIVVITNACAEFNHWDEQKHNAELHYGAADVLTVYLSQTDDDEELRMICAALEMVFRASAKHVKTAFGKVGSSSLPLLLRVLEQCENNQVKNAEAIMMSVTKTFLIFSRVPDLRAFLARHHGMLDALKRVATSNLDVDSRILRMRVFANLANCDVNKIIILKHPGLLESLLRIAALDTSEPAREYAGLSLMDLASEPENQVPMATVDKLLGTLVKLAIMEKIPETRESAVTTLQNLAFAKENRVRLVTYGSGVVLEALKKAVGQDKDSKTRKRAAGALTNLACDETGECMGSHKGLLDILVHVSIRDHNLDVQLRAAMALTKIASCVTCSMTCHKNILDALVIASESSHALSAVVAVMRVKTRDPECRESMAFHPGVLDTLADIAVDTKLPLKDRDNAMRAIMHLTNEPHNLKVMCCKKILSALVVGVAQGEDEIASSAITAMERLATEFSNRVHMARHEGLLTAVAMATEREAKLELSDTSKSLPLLAKPLLLSLLVAM